MFGYVTVNKSELKIRELELYQSYYCGLCRELKDRYGVAGRIGLNYDMNFLLLLLTGLYEPQKEDLGKGCMLHPFEKRPVRRNRYTEYAADMNLLLMYYKCQDDWTDEKKCRSAVYKTLLRKGQRKVREKYPQKAEQIERAINALTECERQQEKDIDKMAELSGNMLGTVFVCHEDEWKDELYRMGSYLGRFIYLCDAYEDIEDDIKKGRYNPFLSIYGEAFFEDSCKELMTMMMAECCRTFERLPIITNVEILRNILYSGVWNRYEITKRKRMAEKENRA